MRKIRNNLKVNTEKNTNRPFDEMICHSQTERKYFTNEINDVIYERLEKETNIKTLPYLGVSVDFGAGDICLEEDSDVFKYYEIDKKCKFEYEEFLNINDAIEKLLSTYKEYDLVDDISKMRDIFYETLNLRKEKAITKKRKLK